VTGRSRVAAARVWVADPPDGEPALPLTVRRGNLQEFIGARRGAGFHAEETRPPGDRYSRRGADDIALHGDRSRTGAGEGKRGRRVDAPRNPSPPPAAAYEKRLSARANNAPAADNKSHPGG